MANKKSRNERNYRFAKRCDTCGHVRPHPYKNSFILYCDLDDAEEQESINALYVCDEWVEDDIFKKIFRMI